jgi:hypothetical protein
VSRKRGHWDDSRELLMLRLIVALLVLFATGCTVGTDIGDEAIGVWIDNDCAEVVQANAAHSAEIAVERLNSSPISISPGESRTVDVIANAAAEPSTYFLAICVDVSDPLVQEFDVERLRAELVRATFESDCATLTEQQD